MSIQEILSRQLQGKYDPERSLRLSCLAKLIPCDRKSIYVINSFIQYAFGIDYTDINSFFKKIHARIALKAWQDKVRRGDLILSETAEPIQRFLVMAIAKGKTWKEIIQEHKLNLLFWYGIWKWQVRQVWLMLLCYIGFSEGQGQVLVCRLLNRSKNTTLHMYVRALKQPYFARKLQIWFNKSKEQLSDIYDDDQRNLLIALSSKTTFSQVLKMQCFTRLKFQNMTIARCHALWICFLCHQIKQNIDRQYSEIHWSMQTITWRTQEINQMKKVEVKKYHELRLKDILEKYEFFEKHFTDEVEVILLTAIKRDYLWFQAKILINGLIKNIKVEEKKSIYKEDKDTSRQKEEKNDSEMNKGKRSKQPQTKIQEQLKLQQIVAHENHESKPIKDSIQQNIQPQKNTIKQSVCEQANYNLNEQQKLVLSLLQKAKENIKSLQMSSIRIQQNTQIQAKQDNLWSNYLSISENIPKNYQSFDKIQVVDNSRIKWLHNTIKPFTFCKEKQCDKQKESTQYESNIDKQHDPTAIFIEGYNKIVEQLSHPHLRVNREINSQNERLKTGEQS